MFITLLKYWRAFMSVTKAVDSGAVVLFIHMRSRWTDELVGVQDLNNKLKLKHSKAAT